MLQHFLAILVWIPTTTCVEYTAATVQYVPKGSVEAPALKNLWENMAAFEELVVRAKKQMADIVVFPEAVLWSFALQNETNMRDAMAEYGEDVPGVGAVPCFHAPSHSGGIVSADSA